MILASGISADHQVAILQTLSNRGIADRKALAAVVDWLSATSVAA